MTLRRGNRFWGRKGGAGGLFPAGAFVYTVDTTNTLTGSSASNQIRLLLFGAGMDFTVDWGDGSTDYITSSTLVIHTYSVGGVYDITWTGVTLQGFRINNNTDRNKFIEVKQWGNLNISINSGFYGCANLDITATDSPSITGTDLSQMFRSCSSLIFNSSIGSWEMGSVTNIQDIFRSAVLFNQNISTWNTISLNNIVQAFFGASAFNQPIGAWDTSSLLVASDALRLTSFNQDLSNWVVTNLLTGNSLLRFLNGETLSTPNYDALLISWAAQSVNSGVVFDAGSGSKYTNSGAALAARNTLTGTYGWTITDGGPA